MEVTGLPPDVQTAFDPFCWTSWYPLCWVSLTVAVLLSGTTKFTVPLLEVVPEGGVTGPRLFVAEKVQPTPGLVVPSRLRICLTTVIVPWHAAVAMETSVSSRASQLVTK